MSDPLATIGAIVRERHDTGAYGDCHLRVHPTVRDLMRSLPASEPAEPWAPSSGLAMLTGIPVVVADDLPDGGWQLVRVRYDEAPPFREEIVREGLCR